MKHKIYSKLWIYFSCLVFLTLVVFSILTGGLILFLSRQGLIQPGGDNHLFVIFILLAFSVLVGTGSSAVVGRRILAPVRELSEKMNSVASGDFSVQANTNQKIEEIQNLFADFNIMVTELNSTETLRNDFVANVSHEFKTPIATIQGYIQLLQHSRLSQAEKADYYARILEGTQQLAHLSDNILRLTKLETQNLPIEKVPFRIDEQIREVLLFLQPRWEEKELELDLHLPKTIYSGNEELLYQVWLNLMDNAVKYSHSKETVAVKLADASDYLTVSFTDRGLSIPETELKRIFDKFYQGDTSRKTAGNGLGLTLVREILQLHGGRVEAELLPEEQTCFTVFLPNHKK